MNKRKGVDVIMKRDRMREEREILSGEIESLHSFLSQEINTLQWNDINVDNFPCKLPIFRIQFGFNVYNANVYYCCLCR